jgi:hypothetical protein
MDILTGSSTTLVLIAMSSMHCCVFFTAIDFSCPATVYQLRSSLAFFYIHVSLDYHPTLLGRDFSAPLTQSQGIVVPIFFSSDLIYFPRYFKHMLYFFSSNPFYGSQIKYLTHTIPISDKILNDY